MAPPWEKPATMIRDRGVFDVERMVRILVIVRRRPGVSSSSSSSFSFCVEVEVGAELLPTGMAENDRGLYHARARSSWFRDAVGKMKEMWEREE